MFQTKITSQGTISLPAALRRKYNLKAGETVTIEDTGKIVVYKAPSFAELRAQNEKYVRKSHPPYQSGDGFAQHVNEKYGKK